MCELGARPALACTCDRAATENQKVLGETCQCGQRAKGESPNFFFNWMSVFLGGFAVKGHLLILGFCV